VYIFLKGKEYTNLVFQKRLFYKIVRHPLLLGFMIAFWATPKMTLGHLVFAIATTAYMLIAIQLEERDMANIHGDAYRQYQREVSMLIPLPKGK
jgi:methanethiol S-methyltransferase